MRHMESASHLHTCLTRDGLRAVVLGVALCIVTGCGASSARIGVGPMLDSSGSVGIESTFSLGFGMPVDYRGRSKHYLQGVGFVGGGADVDTNAGIVTAGLGADYIYWAHRRFDVRAGLQFAYRNRRDEPNEKDLFGVGAHLALMGVGATDDSSWIVPQLCFGPEVRIDQMWDSKTGHARTHFVFPLVVEVNLLAAGD